MKKYLNHQDVMEEFEVSRQALWRWRKLGEFPKGKRMPGGQIRWRATEIEAWFNALDDAK